MDGSSSQQGNDVGVILEGSSGLLIVQALRFTFKANNNQDEYEALIARMLLAKELGARSFLVKSDSLLVTRQVTGEYQAKDLLIPQVCFVSEGSFLHVRAGVCPKRTKLSSRLIVQAGKLGEGRSTKVSH